MAEIKKPHNFQQIILPVVLTVVITSLPWLYFYNLKHHQLSLADEIHQNQLDALERQLDQQMLLKQELINSLSASQEARVKAESELAEISAKLAQSEEKLSELDTMDWERKYKFALLDNEILVEQIAELEFRQEQDNEQLLEAYNQLDETKKYIEEDFIRLEFDYDELLEEDSKLKNQYLNDMQELANEADALKATIGKNKDQIKKQEKIIASLKKDNLDYKNTLEQGKKEIVAESKEIKIITPDTIKKSGKTGTDNNFRSARLKSLSNAMLNRNSNDRKNILVSVIPNIPDGVTGNELTSLVEGMESADILSVIQSTTTHINKPLSSEVFSRLTRNMNNQEAALATNLLSGE